MANSSSDPVMREVFSSAVKRIGYDAPTGDLHVVWQNGKRSIYEGVPADVANRVSSAWSIGKAVREDVQGKYPHKYGDG